MASSPVKFLFFLVFTCIFGWLISMFASRLIAWLLGRVLRADIKFKISGCRSLRDVSIRFSRGAIESIAVGEIKLSLRKSLIKLGVGFIYKDPKLQLLISDLEVTLRQSEKKEKKASSKKTRSPGKGKLMILANLSRFLSISVSELTLKTPKAICHVKELGVDLFRNTGPNNILCVRLHLSPFTLLMGESRFNSDHSGCLIDRQASLSNNDKNGAPFTCDELLMTCEFGHDREMGIKVNNLELNTGDIAINLNEELFCMAKTSSHGSRVSDTRGNLDASSATKSEKDKTSSTSLNKHLLLFPEKVNFNLPRLDVRLMHRGHDILMENNVTGIQLRSTRSVVANDSGESVSHFDVQMDLSEIHILREDQSSVVEILKVAVITSVDVPFQPAVPVRSEIDIKLGGAQINIIMSRLVPLLALQKSKKKMSLREDGSQENSSVSKPKILLWTCTVSAPEMIIVLYSIKGLPLYHGCSQSSHLYANNVTSNSLAVHAELGELHFNMADKHHECLKENVFGVETSSDSLVHIARVSLDWGSRQMELRENHDANKSKLVFSIDVTGMGVYFNFQHVESIVTTAMSFKSILRSISSKKSTHDKPVRSSSKRSKGLQIIKLSLGQCTVIFSGVVGIEDAVIADPKRVNYGSQGGEIIFTMSADGTPRKACIMSADSGGSKLMRNSISLDVNQLNLLLNKEKKSTRIEFQRVRSFYKEYLEEQHPCTNVNLLDMQNAKIVRRLGGTHETSICSLFGASNITLRWEPDIHVALYELILRVKFLVHREKSKISSEAVEELDKDTEFAKESSGDSLPSDKQHRKKESVFAVDIETLNVSAGLADGVEAMILVQSIFSENARIGILLEGLNLSFNDCRVIKSSRMQISRLPVLSPNLPDAKAQGIVRWDWVVQGLDVSICLPYRLQLRAIDDAFEDTLRALKLVLSAKTNIIFPVKKENSKKIKSKSSNFGSIKFNIRKITAEIEEEPLQGWLDEHYNLLKNEVCELAVRMKFLDDIIADGNKQLGDEQSEVAKERKFKNDGVDFDVSDNVSVQTLREEIYRRSFKSYYSACRKIIHSEGSGACSNGFQAGFKFSKKRSSLLLICAEELELSMTAIEGGEFGMIEFIKKFDPVASENNIPFSRLYGTNLILHTGSLVAQLRDYPFPLFAGTGGKCEGRIVLAQQATCFQPQIEQDVYVGRWRKVRMLRSATGTTPAVKTYSNLPIIFQKGEVCFGVGFEPIFADVSYAFTVALRRANLSTRSYDPNFKNLYGPNQPPKKERSLPWWDDMRNYIHGNISLSFSETRWNILASTNPYERLNKLQVVSGSTDIHQSDGCVSLSVKELKIFISSLESLIHSRSLKELASNPLPLLESPSLFVEILMEWGCDSGNPLNHYLHALPVEGEPREKVLDPFRSTSLSLKWNFSLRSSQYPCGNESIAPTMENDGLLPEQVFDNPQKSDIPMYFPTINLGPHDLVWIIKFWNLNFLPPHKLRSFSRWPRFGVPRIPRSGNLSLDRVMIEFYLRIDSEPIYIRHAPILNNDPASGLMFKMSNFKLEHCLSRGKQQYTFDCKREPLDLVYQGLDLYELKAYFNRDSDAAIQDDMIAVRTSQSGIMDKINVGKTNLNGCSGKCRDDGFLLYSDCFSIRKQTEKADPESLEAWKNTGRKQLDENFVRSEFEDDSDSDHTRSETSDGEDDGYNVVVADNCQRVFVYGLKLLWSIENRNAVLSWVGGLAKAFEPPKPSPSHQYAQRKRIEDQQNYNESEVSLDKSEVPLDESEVPLDESEVPPDESSNSELPLQGAIPETSPSQQTDLAETPSSVLPSTETEDSTTDSAKKVPDDDKTKGTLHFMVNVVQPQFNLHSEEANGRFLLAAASGRVLARSFDSFIRIGYDIIEKTLDTTDMKIPKTEPELAWKRAELSVMLEHVQSHVAPTDVDPGAGIQWLPEIGGSSPKVKRTSALLERVFMPCQMYFRYTRHKHDSAEWKLKPLKELNFNSSNITANMTSRQFQVMLDVLTNLLFSRTPKFQNNIFSIDDEDDEEIDDAIPYGIEEVELAKIKLEQNEREKKLLLHDIRTILPSVEGLGEPSLFSEQDSDFWMIGAGNSKLVRSLKKDLAGVMKSKKVASSELRTALQKAAQLRLMEKEKNKSPSSAMCISVRINRVVWSMLADGKPFAEAEINDMAYDFERDYKDIGIAKFTTKSIEVKNWLSNAKSTTLLSPWNAPHDWGKEVMLRVFARQGAPKDGTSPLELFQVDIHPLKIHLTEAMYRKIWGYFFPEEEQDSHRRQEVWKVSTIVGSKRNKKSVSSAEGASNSQSKELEAPSRTSAAKASADTSNGSKLQNQKASNAPKPELRRTSSLDRTWEENVAESVANDLVLQVQSSSSKRSSLGSGIDEDVSKVAKSKDSKLVKYGGHLSTEEKKVAKTQDEKRTRNKKMMEFHNIEISQVELLVTYAGSRFTVNDFRLLMDSFHRVDFTGTWGRLFSRVKKHIIWGVLKSVTGMQGKKFKVKSQGQKEAAGSPAVPDIDLNFSDSDVDQHARTDHPIALSKRPSDGAGDGFVTSIKGLFSSQRHQAKKLVLRTMRGSSEEELRDQGGGSDVEFPRFARQLTITKAKGLIRRHSKKYRSKGRRSKRSGGTSRKKESHPPLPGEEGTPYQSDSSETLSPRQDFQT